ncbi:MAG TPA: hypothetical protein DCW88_02710, partial [Agrobacterium sp.]|nr:hypothetical protein [Agrobacterium sp.]
AGTLDISSPNIRAERQTAASAMALLLPVCSVITRVILQPFLARLATVKPIYGGDRLDKA